MFRSGKLCIMESTPLLNAQVPVLSRRRLITIEPVQFLYSLYYAGSLPLIGQFVRSQLERQYSGYNSRISSLTCGVAYSNSDADRIEAEASTWLIYMAVAAMIPAFFTTVLLGGYSDATGRKIAVIPPLVGAAVRLLLFIIIIFFDLHPGFMIAASVCDGLGGGMCALLMASFSYITSITGTRSRSRRVVIVEFFSGLAIVVSNVSVGHAIDTLGFAWTFVMLLGFIVTALCYAVFILPEVDSMSTSSADRVDFFTAKHFRQVLALYVKDDSDGSHRHWKLRFTLLILGIASALQIGSIDVQTLFMLSAPLCLTAVWIGYYYATSHFVMILTTLVVTHIFAHRVGDLILVAVGLVFGTGYMVMFGLSTNRVMLFIASFTGCAYRIPIALIRAYNSKIVRPDELGLMFASVAWMEIAGSLLGEVVQNAMFAATVSWMPNFVFMIGGSVYLLAALLTACFIGWLRYKNLDVTVSQVHHVDIQSAADNSDAYQPD